MTESTYEQSKDILESLDLILGQRLSRCRRLEGIRRARVSLHRAVQTPLGIGLECQARRTIVTLGLEEVGELVSILETVGGMARRRPRDAAEIYQEESVSF